MQFTKMHGAGNDYVYIDTFRQPVAGNMPELARRISDRHYGVGGDGLILIGPSQIADARMQMYNADGSEAEMCGNGIRCVAKYVFDHGICRRNPLEIETGAGILRLDLELDHGKVRRVRVDMGEPILEAARIPTTFSTSPVVQQPIEVSGRRLAVTCISMGNPHCITFVDQLSDQWVLGIGPKLEIDPHFPARVNAEFVQVVAPHEVYQRTWERGSGETMACGTGASAVCVAGVLAGHTERRITVHLSGGDLEIEWNESDNHVFMTGGAEEVFHGQWPD